MSYAALQVFFDYSTEIHDLVSEMVQVPYVGSSFGVILIVEMHSGA